MKNDRTFLITGLLGGLIVWLINLFNLTKWSAFVDQLFIKGGASGKIATLVLWLVFWVLISLLIRLLRVRKERNIIAKAQYVINKLEDENLLKTIYEHPQSFLRFGNSQFHRRLILLQDRLADHNRSDRLSFLLASQSGLDAAHAESAYGLLRALIWAMPGLGFMGTAFEMAQAVNGMGSSLGGTSDYIGLRNLLVADVIPYLGGAFNITLFALGGSVLCFLLLSIVLRKDEEISNAADTVALTLLSKIPDKPPQISVRFDGFERDEGVTKGLRDLNTALIIANSELSKVNEFINRAKLSISTLFKEERQT